MVLSLLQSATKSWKTTSAGLIAWLLVVLPELALLDWNVVIGATLIMLGLSAARDGDKSSEDHKSTTPKVQT